jgi:hypothetical protein
MVTEDTEEEEEALRAGIDSPRRSATVEGPTLISVLDAQNCWGTGHPPPKETVSDAQAPRG